MSAVRMNIETLNAWVQLKDRSPKPERQQEKAHAFSAHRLPGKRAVFQFARNKSVLPNYYYFYLDDADWGECFIKVCSYAPWGLKLYLNGHEWLKRQSTKEGIGFESLDDGFLVARIRSDCKP